MQGPGRVSNDKLMLCLSVSQPLPPYPTLHLSPSSDPGTCHPLCLEPTFSRPSHDPFPAPAGSCLSLVWAGVIVCTLQIFVSEWTPFTPSLSLSLSQSLCVLQVLVGLLSLSLCVPVSLYDFLHNPCQPTGLCPLAQASPCLSCPTLLLVAPDKGAVQPLSWGKGMWAEGRLWMRWRGWVGLTEWPPLPHPSPPRQPDKLVVVWTRRNRRICSKVGRMSTGGPEWGWGHLGRWGHLGAWGAWRRAVGGLELGSYQNPSKREKDGVKVGDEDKV